MPLRGPLWLQEQALREQREGGALAALSQRIVDLGTGRINGTRGHVFQATGAVQQFLDAYPIHIGTINAAPPAPYRLTGQVLQDWLTFFAGKAGEYRGNFDFVYSYDTLRNILTPKYGGTRTGGGGGDNEFEICLRLCAAFI